MPRLTLGTNIGNPPVYRNRDQYYCPECGKRVGMDYGMNLERVFKCKNCGTKTVARPRWIVETIEDMVDGTIRNLAEVNK